MKLYIDRAKEHNNVLESSNRYVICANWAFMHHL